MHSERTQIWAAIFEPFLLYGGLHHCQDGCASVNRLFHLGLPRLLKVDRVDSRAAASKQG